MKKYLSIIAFLILLSLWQLVTYLFNIADYLLPSPLRVIIALKEMALSGALIKHCVDSLFRVTWGFYLALFTAIPLGLLLGRKRLFRNLLNPIIQFLRPISPLAWIPMALMWFGIGDFPAIFLIFLASFFPLVVFTMSAVMAIKPIYFKVAKNFGLSGIKLYLKVILPAALPEIIVGIRVTLGTAWLVIVAAEMIAVKSGLGYLIIDARNSLRMDRVIAGMIVIGFVGITLDNLIRRLEKMPSVEWSRMRQ